MLLHWIRHEAPRVTGAGPHAQHAVAGFTSAPSMAQPAHDPSLVRAGHTRLMEPRNTGCVVGDVQVDPQERA